MKDRNMLASRRKRRVIDEHVLSVASSHDGVVTGNAFNTLRPPLL